LLNFGIIFILKLNLNARVFPETFPVYINILQDRNKRASGALCLVAFVTLAWGLMYHIGLDAKHINLHDSSLGTCDASLSATIRIQVLPFVQGRHTHETALPHGRCNGFPGRWNRVYAVMPSCHAGLFRG
jgi:hypothetical protein